MTTAEEICDRLIWMMQNDVDFNRYPAANYAKDIEKTMNFPNVIVFLESYTTERAGIGGHKKQTFTIVIWFREKNLKQTVSTNLYHDAENLEDLLNIKSRLTGGAAGTPLSYVQKSVVTNCRQLFGREGAYFIDVMECKVEVLTYKTF